MKASSKTLSFWLLLCLAFLLTFTSQMIHETGHWLVLRAFDRNPVWSFTKLVQVWEQTPQNPEGWQKTTTPEGETGWLKLAHLPDTNAETLLFPIAGPIASLIGLVAGLGWAKWRKKSHWQTFGRILALSISLGMVLYYLRSPCRTGGDEAEFALAAGVNVWLVNGLFAAAFLIGLILALKPLPEWQTRLRWLAATFLGSALAGVSLTLLDRWVIQGVLVGKPFFQPVLGFSLPVLLVNGLFLGSTIALLQFHTQLPSLQSEGHQK